MRNTLIFGFPVAALASVVPRATDPCQSIAGKPWVKPSQVNACLSYFPFDAKLRDNVVDVVSKTFTQFHTSTSFHRNMPSPFQDDTVDLLGELSRIKRTTYKNDYEVHKAVSGQVKRLGDGHAGYLNFCYDSIYLTYLPFPIAVLATPEYPKVQNIYVVPEASEVATTAFSADAINAWESALGRKLAAFNGAQIVKIDGQDPWTYIDNLAAHSGGYQARTTRQNGFFASYSGSAYRMGEFAQLSWPPQKDSLKLTLVRKGKTQREEYNVPYLSQPGAAFTDAKSFWANFCVATASTNGSPNSASSTSSSSLSKNETQHLAAQDPYSQPARFQTDPIMPVVEGGKKLLVSSLVLDGPESNVELPPHLLPGVSLSSVGPMDWYMLDDGKTAVLHLSSFSGQFGALQQGVLDGLQQVKSKGATKLLIDLLAGPAPGLDKQPGFDGSVRAQALPMKIVSKIIANNAGVDPGRNLLYNPLSWKNANGQPFTSTFNWLSPSINAQVNGISDKFSQKIGDFCLPFALTPPATKPFEFQNIAILTNGRCASSCSLFSITMATKYNVKTVVVGGRPKTTQQYCGVVGGQSTNLVTMHNEVNTVGLTNDPLAPGNFLTNSYQGLTWKLGWSLLDRNAFEEFKSHPAQFTFPLLPSTVNNPKALWTDVSKRLWPN
ncbi:hypothetical protein FRC10_008767 [Ceratobasidium sp. 414]|nr:hypothetical protein FRC10_008767 [Ceratobasidium sp. 414]